MTVQLLKKRYPWYGKHANAVNTLTMFMVVDVANILRQLDRRMRLLGTGSAGTRQQEKRFRRAGSK